MSDAEKLASLEIAHSMLIDIVRKNYCKIVGPYGKPTDTITEDEIAWLDGEHLGYLACCLRCNGMNGFHDSEQAAIEAWNRRS
jgi:hypothetical protein